MKIHPQIGPYCHALCAQELERRGLSVGSSVNSALWLENLDSLSTSGHQMNHSRITSNRDIVGQIRASHCDVPAVPPFVGRVLVSFFLKTPAAYRNFEGPGEGSRQHGAAVLHADRDRPHQPRIYGCDLYYELRVLHST